MSNDVGRDNKSFVLQVQNVSKIFNTPAGKLAVLKNINISIRKGELVSIVGPSGSGKTTLLNIIGALDRPTLGDVIISGISLSSLNESELADIRNNLIGFIFQSFNLINRTTVQKNIEIPAMIMGMSINDRQYRSQKLLELLGIKEKAQEKPVNLSGGQQQRVAIARALINNPSIILADEPTGNLDTKTGEDVFNLLKMLTKKHKKTIILVTHNPELASQTDRTIFIKDGRVDKQVYSSTSYQSNE